MKWGYWDSLTPKTLKNKINENYAFFLFIFNKYNA